jgi:hypothetical protein
MGHSEQLPTHFADLMAAYNFARRLKTPTGLTPYVHIVKIWTSEPGRFIIDRVHQMPADLYYWSRKREMTVGDTSNLKMRGDSSRGSHQRVYRTPDNRLIIEWEEYSDPAPYDHANTIAFNTREEGSLREALGEPDATRDMTSLNAQRFDTYWDVRKFADKHGIPYKHNVDFSP